MAENPESNELPKKRILFIDPLSFDEGKSTRGNSVTFVYSPNVNNDNPDIENQYDAVLIYAIDFPSRHAHPGLVELAKHLHEVIPPTTESEDEKVLSGGRIGPSRAKDGIVASATYKIPTPPNVLDQFIDYLKAKDSEQE